MKRWYQLSMLQLLVAMAVVAVFAVLNMPSHGVRQHVIASLKTMPGAVYIYSGGWPFACYEQRTRIEAQGLDTVRTFRWHTVAGNIATCLLAMATCVKFTSLLVGRKIRVRPSSSIELTQAANHDRT